MEYIYTKCIERLNLPIIRIIPTNPAIYSRLFDPNQNIPLRWGLLKLQPCFYRFTTRSKRGARLSIDVRRRAIAAKQIFVFAFGHRAGARF